MTARISVARESMLNIGADRCHRKTSPSNKSASCMSSAAVAGLNAVRRSSRHAEYKAQYSNGQGRGPMLHCYHLFLEVTT
jgi:hypothetical protein